MEKLWVALYERGYIEVEDVRAVQLWLKALLLAGYRFPSFSHDATNATSTHSIVEPTVRAGSISASQRRGASGLSGYKLVAPEMGD